MFKNPAPANGLRVVVDDDAAVKPAARKPGSVCVEAERSKTGLRNLGAAA